ncbi:MAG: (2Fe-2S) ferredoxin domain-containing protein [Pseudomonadota bacterium]
MNFRPFSGQPSCAFRGSKQLADWLEDVIRERNLPVTLERTVCMGHCPRGPNFRLRGGEFIHEANREKLLSLLDRLEEA